MAESRVEIGGKCASCLDRVGVGEATGMEARRRAEAAVEATAATPRWQIIMLNKRPRLATVGWMQGQAGDRRMPHGRWLSGQVVTVRSNNFALHHLHTATWQPGSSPGFTNMSSMRHAISSSSHINKDPGQGGDL